MITVSGYSLARRSCARRAPLLSTDSPHAPHSASRAVAVSGGGGADMDAREVPVTVRCHLCHADSDHVEGWLTVTRADRAWYDAHDHAIDEHRRHLFSDPVNTLAAFTVSSGQSVAPLNSVARTR